MEPILASDNAETALIPHGSVPVDNDEQSEDYSSSEEEEEEVLPPGPIDPEKCSVGGPGTSGGSAQAPVSFYIHARDSRNTRLEEGGAYVVVKVIPGNSAKAGGAFESEAIVNDNGDGTYTATYSAAARGDYELTVEINGSAVGGSPFPVFFSPPEDRALGDGAIVRDATGQTIDASTVSSATANVSMPVISILGAEAYAAKVGFPTDSEILDRTVIVGNLNPQVTIEQLTQLFSYSGSVTQIEFAGRDKKFVFTEFATPKEAEQALTLDKLLVVDRQIRVEPARTALESKGQSGGTQFAALQLQQIQQLQKAQMEQHSLAAQVAQMRVQAKTNPTAFVPGLPQNSASQKAAALSAIAALSKRLTGSTHGGSAPAQDPAPTVGTKRRREVSPTLRYRSDKRERSRSPARRRSSPRRRSPPRRRSRERRRTPERIVYPPDRRRERGRDRLVYPRRDHRGSSRDRDSYRESSRERRRNRDRSHEPRDRSRRGRERRSQDERSEGRHDSKEPGRSSSQTQDREHRQKLAVSGDEKRHRDAPSDLEASIVERHEKEPPSNELQGKGDELPAVLANGKANPPAKSSQADEAQDLREKALEALKTLRREDDAEAKAERSQGLEEKRERRHKHKKDKKHKKEKRSRRDPDNEN